LSAHFVFPAGYFFIVAWFSIDKCWNEIWQAQTRLNARFCDKLRKNAIDGS